MTEKPSEIDARIHEELDEIEPDADVAQATETRSFDDLEAEAAFWRGQFEQERERLAKLWVAYKDLDAELKRREAETQEIAEKKVAAQLEERDETSERAEPATGTTDQRDVAPELAVPQGARDADAPEETAEPREDPFGDIHPVVELEGIGDVYAKALEEAGIKDTRRLWQADAETVAKAADVSPNHARRWQAQAELMAIDEIGPQYAELLVRSGITSIEALREQEPAELLATVEKKQDELDVRIQGNVPTERRVRRWIEAAENHDV